MRAKAFGRYGLIGLLERGIGVIVAMQAMSGLDQLQPVPAMCAVGEYRIVPDLEPFRVLPDAPRTGAVLTDHTLLDGEPATVRQRLVPQAAWRRGSAERGAGAAGGVRERVRWPARRTTPTSRSTPVLCFSTHSMTASQKFADELVGALDKQKIPLEQYYAELGAGQQEISTAHAPALQAADEQLLVRETIRGVASSLELVASLAPKPWPDNAGNGQHIHFSLWGGRPQPLLRRGLRRSNT